MEEENHYISWYGSSSEIFITYSSAVYYCYFVNDDSDTEDILDKSYDGHYDCDHNKDYIDENSNNSYVNGYIIQDEEYLLQ